MIQDLNFYFILVNAMLFILIWLVQIIIYPSFIHISPTQFQEWHSKYTRLISFFVIPLMLVQMFLAFVLLNQSLDYLIFGLIFSVWVTTALLSVPCHNQLHQNGYNSTVLQQLIWTNWPRTIAWTLCFGLSFLKIK